MYPFPYVCIRTYSSPTYIVLTMFSGIRSLRILFPGTFGRFNSVLKLPFALFCFCSVFSDWIFLLLLLLLLFSGKGEGIRNGVRAG